MEDITYFYFENFIIDNFSLLYNGNVNDEITFKIIGLSEDNFEYEEGFAKSKKKMKFLLAESFQNIIRHGDKIKYSENEIIDSGFFLTRNINGVYFITSGNLINNENINALKRQLEKINALDNSKLRALHIDVLENKGFSDKGGAGLGLIEMARKSGQKIDFVFDEFRDGYSIFYNQIMLNPSNIKLELTKRGGKDVADALKMHKNMLSEGILMIQKGDFSQSYILPFIEILKKNIPDFFQQTHPRKEPYHVLVELLQNISKYGVEINGRKEGIFLIRKKHNRFIISAGNFVEQKHIDPLKAQIILLNGLTKEEIKKMYLRTLNEEQHVEKVRIELIEVARRSIEPIRFTFNEPKANMFFFTINVTV